MDQKIVDKIKFGNNPDTIFVFQDLQARNQIVNLSGKYLSLSGGTMSGNVNFQQNTEILSGVYQNQNFVVSGAQLTGGLFEITSSNIYLGNPQDHISTGKLFTLKYLDGTDCQSRYNINVGFENKVSGWCNIAVGSQNTLSGSHSIVNGWKCQALENVTHAEGQKSKANSEGSHAEGYSCITSGKFSHAEGQNTQTLSQSSHSQGINTITSGNYSHAEGNSNKTLGQFSHAEGNETKTNGTASHAEGNETNANGQYSHSEGYLATTNGIYAHAEGNETKANGTASHAEGYLTAASGNYSHAEGWSTTANGSMSHAEGQKSKANSEGSHAEGYNTKSNEKFSHAEGKQTNTYGLYSHAQGEETSTSGMAAHAEGYNTQSIEAYQHVEGKYNIPLTGYQKIVGSGTSSQRKNIHTLDWSGNAEFAGNISGNTFIINGHNVNTANGLVQLNSNKKIPEQLYEKGISGFVETDPIYTADKPNIALKSELPTKVSQLTNDVPYLSAHQSLDGKVDKVAGKQLISSALITKLEGLDNYDDSELRTVISGKANKSEIPSAVSQLINDVPYLSTACLTFPADVIQYAQDWDGTTKTFCQKFCDFGHATAGSMYMGSLNVKDLPFPGNAECLITIPVDGIMELQLFSTTTPTHKWTAMYDGVMIDVGSAASPWKGTLTCPVTQIASTPIYTPLSDYDAVTKKYVDDAITGKVNVSDFISHTENTNIHITVEERTTWNAKQNEINSTNKLDYSLLSGTPTTLSGYGITNAYTKTEVDDAISGKVTFKLVSQLPTTLEENTLYGIPQE